MERGTRQREGEVEEEEGSPNHETIIMAKGQIRRERERGCGCVGGVLGSEKSLPNTS